MLTPPLTATAAAQCRARRLTVFYTSTSTTASWNDAHTSARLRGWQRPGWRRAVARVGDDLRQQVTHGGFQAAETERVIAAVQHLARQVETRRSPSRASRSICGPPGYGSPSSFAPLSNASPAASSSVPPSRRYRPNPATSTSRVWPPLTTRPTAGGYPPAASRRRRRWPSRWLTPKVGFPGPDRQAFRGGRADHQGTRQPRPVGGGESVHLGEAHPGLSESMFEQRPDFAQVLARRSFRARPRRKPGEGRSGKRPRWRAAPRGPATRPPQFVTGCLDREDQRRR